MAKLVYGLNQSLDGYVDHLEFRPSPALVRVHKAASGEVTVTDGPFAETKEVLGGYALLNAASKEEAVEHTRRFLDHVGQGSCDESCEGTWEGTWEVYQLFEMPTGEGQ